MGARQPPAAQRLGADPGGRPGGDPGAAREIAALLARPDGVREDGFYIHRRQIFRGKPLRFGGYGSKLLLKLFRRSRSELDPVEQDTRVYVRGPVGRLRAPLEEWNRKEDSILFYLQKHLRYAEAFAQEELERRRRGLPWKADARASSAPPTSGSSGSRTATTACRCSSARCSTSSTATSSCSASWTARTGFIFHFLQAFWFRLMVDIRLEELLREPAEDAA